jgi:phosphoribosyl-ATP pyrophosphohydrolase
MAKSPKKKRPVPRDPLIARATKTLKTTKAPKPGKTLKSKKRRKPAQPGAAAHHAAASLSRVAPPLAIGPAAAVLDRLWSVIMGRRSADPAVSHSARLLSRGTAKVAQKFGEEAVECLIEAVAGNRDALVAESADVLYHLIVLWVSAGVAPNEVWDELKRREGISGIAEKAARVKTLPVAFGLETTKIP